MTAGSERLAAELDRLNRSGWPPVLLPKGVPARSDYLPKEFEPGHVRRGRDGAPVLRLVDVGDRLALQVPDVGGALVNPKGPGLRGIGFVTTYARGATYYGPTFRTADLRPGRLVELRRDAGNEHDRNAVALHGPGARKPFGFVARGRASSVAKRLDAGEDLAAICLRGPGPGRDDDSAFLLLGAVDDLLALLRSEDA